MTIVYCLFGTYSTGGIERVTTLKMNYLAEHGYDVHLITTGHAGRPSYYPLDPRIHHVDLGICYDEPGPSLASQSIDVTIGNISGMKRSLRGCSSR